MVVPPYLLKASVDLLQGFYDLSQFVVLFVESLDPGHATVGQRYTTCRR